MRQLRESSFAETSAKVLRSTLRRDGYLLLRGLVPTHEVATAAAASTSVLTKRGWVRDGNARLSRRLRGRRPTREQTTDIYRTLQSTEALHRLVCHRAIRHSVESLLGPAMVHPQRPCRPDGGRDWREYTTAWSSTSWVELPPEAIVIDDEHRPWDELTALPPSALLIQLDGFR